MREMPLALLITGRPNSVSDLEALLESRGFAVYVATGCAEAALLVESKQPPQLIFSDADLPDGSWREALALARKCSIPVHVIVISRAVDISLYIQVLEHGAFDFIVPPFEVSEIDHVVRNALASVVFLRGEAKAKRREELRTDEPPAPDDGLEVSVV